MLTSFQVNGNELNAPNSGNTLWLEYPIQGLEAPSYRVSSWDRAGQDGAGLTIPFYGVRTVTIQGKIRRTTDAVYVQARTTLLQAFQTNRDSNGNIIKQTYQFTRSDGSTFFFYGQAKTPVFSIEQMGWTNWKTDILVGDPYIYLITSGSAVYAANSGDTLATVAASTGLTVLELLLLNPTLTSSSSLTAGQVLNVALPSTTGQWSPPQGGGFLVPTNVPTVSTLTGVSAVTAFNTGNMTTPALIFLRGPLTTPFLQNNTLGLSVKLNYTFGSSDVAVIDMLNKTIVLNQTTSLLGYKDNTSHWWGIVPGANSITLSSGSSSDTGTAEVTWYNAVSGV